MMMNDDYNYNRNDHWSNKKFLFFKAEDRGLYRKKDYPNTMEMSRE